MNLRYLRRRQYRNWWLRLYKKQLPENLLPTSTSKAVREIKRWKPPRGFSYMSHREGGNRSQHRIWRTGVLEEWKAYDLLEHVVSMYESIRIIDSLASARAKLTIHHRSNGVVLAIKCSRTRSQIVFRHKGVE